MKRSFKNFSVILILVSMIAAGIGVSPVRAAASLNLVPIDLPTGWRSGFLYGIWGSSDSNVYAVGYGDNGTTDLPLLYHKSGSSWTASGLLLPFGWSTGYLFGIWGSGPSDVYAVGYGYNGTAVVPLVYRWDGTNWNVFTLPLPAGVTAGSLSGIWGSSGNDIYVVGYGFSSGGIVPLIYHKDNLGWSASPVTLPVGWSSVNLKGMWGSGIGDAFAVGTGFNGTTNLPLVYSRSGATWTTTGLSLPAGTSAGYLSGMWGASVTDAYAVGYAYSGSTPLPLLYHRAGSAWSEASPSLPSGWNSAFLYGVWGSSPTDVYTVGSGNNGSVASPLIYHNGSGTWAESSPALPVGWISGSLFSIWGSSASDVYAVGSGSNGVTILPLVYHSNQIEQDLTPPGNVTNFTAVTGTDSGSVNLSWTAPAADTGNPGSGPASAYLIKYSTSPFTSWADGTPVLGGIPQPAAPGTTQGMKVSGLNPDTRYYFAIRAQDEHYNLSAAYVTDNAQTLRPGTWHIAGMGNLSYGVNGDIPVVADYNGNGKDDVAVFRPSSGTWFIRGIGSFAYGQNGDIPVPGDYNGDGRADAAVFRPSSGTWFIRGIGSFAYGQNGDIPVPGDYNGDGRADAAVFRPSSGTWFIRGIGSFAYGQNGDIPVPGDFFGDNRTEIAVFRP